MKPSKFEHQNAVYNGGPGIDPLPAYRGKNESGADVIVSLWRPSLRERLSFLFFGRIWLVISGAAQPPVFLGAERELFVKRLTVQEAA